MQKVIFPYILDRPIIPIQIKHTRENIWIPTEGYVDSGASFSIFSLNDAVRIGVTYRKGKEMFVTVGDGGVIPIYLHTLSIKIGNISFKGTIAFSARLGVGFNLIGRKDFFGHFDVVFSDTDKIITFLSR